jgi:uncharacterized protein (DUF1800 family)
MQCVRGPVAALVGFTLLWPVPVSIGQPLPEGDSPTRRDRPAYRSAQFQGDERILHALNRLTFGPRPGDLDVVRAQGLERWFDAQLHPEQINDSDLNARLAAWPAMQWSSEELLYRLPSNAVIRQAIDGKLAVPEHGVLHAVYEDAMFRVAARKQQKQNPDDAPAETPAINPESVTALLALSPEQRVAGLAAMQPADADAFFKSLRVTDRTALTAGMTPELKETAGALANPQRTVVEELLAQRLTRDIYSNAQLQEVMTDFWFNHFNVFLHKNETTPYYLVSYERDVIRPHALGKFGDMLEAVAHSPAMLLYLDNASSTGPDSPAAERARLREARNSNAKKTREGLNENYARELMELHTLGVNGGYTQTDVIQVARILTGWTVDRPQRGGDFRFDPNRHEPGTKKVMGRKFKEGGEHEGRDLLHFLATRPATATFLSRKLAVRFVSDDPPASLVDRMAKSYMSSGGDIAAVLKTMFHSPEFWSASVYRAKVKTPLEYVVSAMRATQADTANPQPLANALRSMGMPLYGAIPPTGYKSDAADWVSTGALVNRMNFALSLAANRLPGITTTWSRQPAADSADAQAQSEEARLEAILFSGRVSESTRAAVLEQFKAQSQGEGRPMQVAASPNPAAQEKQYQLLAGLLLGSPEFQRR